MIGPPVLVAAIEADSERRKSDIQQSVPGFLRELSIQFASTTASSTYVAMQAGRTVYRRYVPGAIRLSVSSLRDLISEPAADEVFDSVPTRHYLARGE